MNRRTNNANSGGEGNRWRRGQGQSGGRGQRGGRDQSRGNVDVGNNARRGDRRRRTDDRLEREENSDNSGGEGNRWRRGQGQSRGRGQRGGRDQSRDNVDVGTNARRGDRRRRTDDRLERGENSDSPRRMGFKLAEKLGDNEDIEEVIQNLFNDKAGFKNLVQSNDLSGDFLVLIVHILSKVSKSSFDNSKIHIYKTVFTNGSYIKQLKSFITSLPFYDQQEMKNTKYFWNDSDRFWYNLIDIFRDMTSTPTLACEILPNILKSLVRTLPILETEQNIHISEEIKDGFKVLSEKVENMKSQMVQKFHLETPQHHHSNMNNEDDWIPPNNFRTVSVIPDIVEVVLKQQPFLRRNKIKGPYRNVEHYLDVQFRLLREDFIAPLRRGICQYLEKSDLKRYDDIKIHQKIHFLCEENINELKCFRIKFDFNNKKKTLKYENSKQFMFGSLVCFSNDQFVSIIFAKIVKRDPEMIKKGELVVGFDGHQNLAVKYNVDYIMVESKVYFEPYYHVLTALQRLTEDNFPMESYIIDVSSEVYLPNYMDLNTMFTIDERHLNAVNLKYHQNLYGLNDSQESALRAALTREISIIQGPPGTGKTFLGLKIAHTLLTNHSLWYNNTPLLVICFTNHALDQFLEGILKSTKKLLRIGGQSKNTTLEKFNLKSKNRTKSRGFYQTQREVTICLNELKKFDVIIDEIRKYNSILDFSLFNGIVKDIEGTWFENAGREDIKNWLIPNLAYSAVSPVSNWFTTSTTVLKNTDSVSDDELSNYSDTDLENDDVDEIFINKTKPQSASNGEINQTGAVKTLISLQSLANAIEAREQYLKDPLRNMLDGRRMEEEMRMYRNTYTYLKEHLDQLRNGINFNSYILRKSPTKMTFNERWALYSHFLMQYLNHLMEEQKKVYQLYQEKYKIYTEQRDMEDLKIMKENLVVGLTTTSAARLRPVLEALKSPIVIVEEAAEVLEAHIMSALTVHCTQLILIGDHQQLRPTTADYTIETKYQMGVSLFERMIQNNIECHTLNIQHRMRPEICNLIRPSIYSELKDHSSVLGRPKILGVDKVLYFINHKKEEQSCGDSTKKNLHEVTFLINLAKYLILNGYSPQNITILATYLGQMFEMQRERKKHSLILRDVRISVLDNYQGEESDIILLSLVRNNKEKINGFLKITNRVCVALSRAKNGLYIMGNMDQLCNDKNSIWPEIRESLEKQNAIGSSLELRCQIHNLITKVKDEVDFIKIPEGGCTRRCGAVLSCGHICKNICHLTDRHHEHYTCIEKCGRRLCQRSEKHLCERPCYQKCDPCHYPVRWSLHCGHPVTLKCHMDPNKYDCSELVLTLLPCGHNENKPCHVKPEDFKCPQPCDALLDCGHACTLKCHVRRDPDHLNYKCPKPCEKLPVGCSTKNHKCRKLCHEKCEPCLVKVKKGRSVCSHFYDVACNADVDALQCSKPCQRILLCGHKCENKCFETCGPCLVTVEKIIQECGHKIKTKCCEKPKRQHCKEKCIRKLVCGHHCQNKCRDSCTTRCEKMKNCNLPSPCGHIVKQIPCFQIYATDEILMKYCTEPCQQILQCQHKCTGNCGECFQGRLHKRCADKCGVPLVCNHECPIPCREACKPCEKKCNYRCSHGRCTKKCGEICVKCMHECIRRCLHKKCTSKCGDICNVEPCEEPCAKLLKCGHNCVGFCNDPCPKLCKICNKSELLEIFFGTEEDDDARFVELQDCGHVMESVGMKCWLENDDGEIQIKVCPKCKTPIINTQRFSEYVKRALLDINSVKLKLNGSFPENLKLRDELLKTISTMKLGTSQLFNVTKLLPVIQGFEDRLQDTRVDERNIRLRQTFSAITLKSITSKVQIVAHIIDICSRYQSHELKAIETQINFILNPLLRDEDQITLQEIEDVQLEISRLKRMVEISEIREKNQVRKSLIFFSRSPNTKVLETLEEIEKLVTSHSRYTDKTDQIVKKRLKKVNCGIQISDSERIEIVKALGLSKGHWFKCPNGHPYVITECGGAMQEFRCPDCGEKIGGTRHTLTGFNQLASEMDGAQFPAWSNVANNMGNYDLRRFRFN
ncbi:NFX1-type zinc finger-containing protein 1 isoform X1 [Leptinotarsa decemlineata]|uniref:NFX1-type zinc finger-containing protein 1 isoform X1 n=1 Tax=Leptinotarsa decemlineata TaxID=7539 RepID=UPI003D304DD1